MNKKTGIFFVVIALLAVCLSVAALVVTLRSVRQNTEIETAPTTVSQETTVAQEVSDTQYVMFLGTNDKDTNEPVFSPEESRDIAEKILVEYFGGYTIQEAHGGWESDGKLYQEYTIVIYLSDTTLDKVHAAAEEMIKTFRQSSVLIQKNRTQTEFYGAE